MLAKLIQLTRKYSLEIFAVVIFLVLLPLAWQINYLQNDEVTHFLTVQNFLSRNFTLHPALIATFYSQGVLTAVWAMFFGFNHAPVLTLLVSVIGIYFFTKIVREFFITSSFTALLLGALLLVNPLFLYSALGNMTENYFLFYFVISLYFFYYYTKNSTTRYLVLSLIFSTLGFLTRQIGLIIPLGYGLYFLFHKRYKESIAYFATFTLITAWYYTVFPRTGQMAITSGAEIKNLSNFMRTYSLVAMVLSYIGVLCFPLIFSIGTSLKSYSKKNLVRFVVISFISAALLFKYFVPSSVVHSSALIDNRVLVQTSKPEFPYFGNVFSRTGFFSDNISGTKYHFNGYFKLFNAFDYIGGISAIILLSYFLFLLLFTNRAKLLTPEFILFVIYLGMVLVLAKVYDRYLLPLFPIFILFVLRVKEKDFTKLEKGFLACFVAFFAFLGYQYSMDFVLVNKYAWQKASSLVETGTNPSKIKAGHAWGVLHHNIERKYEYHIAYQIKRGYEIVEKYKIEFPLSIYVDPYVYLLKKTL